MPKSRNKKKSKQGSKPKQIQNIQQTQQDIKPMKAMPISGLNPVKQQTAKICLVMIVKDEAGNIRECLSKVAPYIHYWVIVDTGSSDNTIEVINQTMEEFGIPGELHERPWVNFEVNRTESLELAKD